MKDLHTMRKMFAAGLEQYCGGWLQACFFSYGGRDYMILRARRNGYGGEEYQVVFRVYDDGSIKWLQRHPAGAGWVQASRNPDAEMSLTDVMGRT
jgi:hypothetical protein